MWLLAWSVCHSDNYPYSETFRIAPSTPLTKKQEPMSRDALLENQLGHLPRFYIYSLSTPRVEIELIFNV